MKNTKISDTERPAPAGKSALRGSFSGFGEGKYTFYTSQKRPNCRLTVRRLVRLATPKASREGYYGVSRG